MHDSDTIAQLITGAAPSAVSVIRISGDGALSVLKKIFKGGNYGRIVSHTVHYGHITDANGRDIDEALVSVMLAPRTYTAEDTVEVGCHGGCAVTDAVLRAIFAAGARPAEPGEFTKRAFLNGRIDLSQAEAVADLITAQTESARRITYSQLKGSLKKAVSSVIDALLVMIAHIEASVDFPDDIPETDGELFSSRLSS